MQTVIETSSYLARAAEVGMSEAERTDIIAMIAADPTAGDVMPGTGGARKLRVAGRGKGKSGGFRVISFYAAEDVPVFLLDVYGKGDKANLTKAECNVLKAILGQIAEAYRASVKARVADLRGVPKHMRDRT